MFEKKRLDDIRHEILLRIADRADAPLALDSYPIFLGASAAAASGSVVICGAGLLDLLINDPPEKSQPKKVRKRLINAATADSGIAASIFLGHALARSSITMYTYLARLCDEEPPPPSEHQMAEELQREFPLDARGSAVLDRALSGYGLFDIESGEFTNAMYNESRYSSGYGGFLLGIREPDDDDDYRRLVDSQFLVAGNWFQELASRYCLELLCGAEDDSAEFSHLAVEEAGALDMSYDHLAGVSMSLTDQWRWSRDRYYEILNRVSEARNS